MAVKSSDSQTDRAEIDLTQYVEDVLRTESTDFAAIATRVTSGYATIGSIDTRPEVQLVLRLLHAALGIVTEAGELVDILKKHLFYGKTLDGMHIMEEFGDLDWYQGIAMDVLAKLFELPNGGDAWKRVLQRNIAKLRRRYPEKFTNEKALNRNLKQEGEVIRGITVPKDRKEYGR